MSAGPVPDPTTALELEKLRGELSTGFAEIKGSLALLVQRAGQTEQVLVEHRSDIVDHERRLSLLEQARAADAELGQEDRLRRLEDRRLPWPLLAAMATVLTALPAAAGALLATR